MHVSLILLGQKFKALLKNANIDVKSLVKEVLNGDEVAYEILRDYLLSTNEIQGIQHIDNWTTKEIGEYHLNRAIVNWLVAQGYAEKRWISIKDIKLGDIIAAGYGSHKLWHFQKAHKIERMPDEPEWWEIWVIGNDKPSTYLDSDKVIVLRSLVS